MSLRARRRKARTTSMIPKIRAKAPIHHVTTMTPASGATTSSTPKITDAAPLRISHQRPYSGWSRSAATTSSTPVTIAHAAIRSTKVTAVSPGQINAITPTAMLRTPSPRDPRVQQIEQQAFRHDAPEIVSRDHHLGEGVAENQLLLSEENHFAMFSHFGSLGAVRSRSIAFTTSSQGLAPIRALATLVQTGSKFEAHRSNRG